MTWARVPVRVDAQEKRPLISSQKEPETENGENDLSQLDWIGNDKGSSLLSRDLILTWLLIISPIFIITLIANLDCLSTRREHLTPHDSVGSKGNDRSLISPLQPDSCDAFLMRSYLYVVLCSLGIMGLVGLISFHIRPSSSLLRFASYQEDSDELSQYDLDEKLVELSSNLSI